MRVEHEGSKWTVKTVHKSANSSNVSDVVREGSSQMSSSSLQNIVTIHSEGFSSSTPSIEPPSVDIHAILSRLDPIDTGGIYSMSCQLSYLLF
jgi:hypothetical protein